MLEVEQKRVGIIILYQIVDAPMNAFKIPSNISNQCFSTKPANSTK